MFKVLGMGDDHSASTHKAVGREHARGETSGRQDVPERVHLITGLVSSRVRKC